MSEVTRILSAIEGGDPSAAAELLPLVYDELRQLAASKLDREKPGQTLDATALVHEAYLRLVASPGHESEASLLREQGEPHFNSRGHFFAAASEAMRRILVESARRKGRLRHGGGHRRLDLDQVAVGHDRDDDLLAVDEALGRLEAEDAEIAAVVKLRYFAGMTAEQAAEALGISLRTANRHWAYARAWLFQALGGDCPERAKNPE